MAAQKRTKKIDSYMMGTEPQEFMTRLVCPSLHRPYTCRTLSTGFQDPPLRSTARRISKCSYLHTKIKYDQRLYSSIEKKKKKKGCTRKKWPSIDIPKY